MKLMIASDIHGSLPFCEKLCARYAAEDACRLLLLGDLLYHGPRNDLPLGYNPKGVIRLLNAMRRELLCVRGNCDAEVDQMVLDFPILADYAILMFGERTVFATHGHIHNAEHLPPLKRGDILLHGHTHVRALRDEGDYVYLNPGSVSIPKGDGVPGYMVYEDGTVTAKDMDGAVMDIFSLVPR